MEYQTNKTQRILPTLPTEVVLSVLKHCDPHELELIISQFPSLKPLVVDFYRSITFHQLQTLAPIQQETIVNSKDIETSIEVGIPELYMSIKAADYVEFQYELIGAEMKEYERYKLNFAQGCRDYTSWSCIGWTEQTRFKCQHCLRREFKIIEESPRCVHLCDFDSIEDRLREEIIYNGILRFTQGLNVDVSKGRERKFLLLHLKFNTNHYNMFLGDCVKVNNSLSEMRWFEKGNTKVVFSLSINGSDYYQDPFDIE